MSKRLLLLVLCWLFLPTLTFAQLVNPKGETLQSAATTGNGTTMPVEGFSSVAIGVIGSAGSDRVVSWQANQDGVNWVGISCTNLNTATAATSATVSGTTPQLWRCDVRGLRQFRAPVSGGTTGTATVTATALPHS